MSDHLKDHNDAPERIDLLIEGRVLTMRPGEAVIENGAVAIDGSDIVAVGERQTLRGRYAPSRTLGGASAIIIPGLIDAHTHCTQCFVRALTAGELPMIPRIYNPAQRVLSPAQAAATVRLIAAQLIASGVTTLCEGTLNPLHEEAIVESLQQIRMRACMARGCADQDFYHASLYSQIKERSWIKPRPGEAESDLMRTDAFLQRFPPGGRQLIRGAVNASGLTGFSETYFREGAALARQHGATIQVHIGRDREEVEFCLSVWGRRPVERLADLDIIDKHLVAVHAVLASEREIELLAEGGAALAHSPIECVANMNAVPNLPRMRRAGIRVALGCDNQANDIFANMRACWVLHGAKWGVPAYDPEFLSAHEVLAMATREAADVLGMLDRVGTLEPGKAADLVILDGSRPHLLAMQELTTELVRYASRAEVLQTIIDGHIVYDRGAFTTIDLQQLRREASEGAVLVRREVESRRYRPLG